jgi:SAM-dependent methyltransferase
VIAQPNQAPDRGRVEVSQNEIPYPGFPRIEAHPGLIGAIARLHGLQVAPAEKCRLLELGCGDGGHLLPLAQAFPRSRFVGIDLSCDAIANGKGLARQAALNNVSLTCSDLRDEFHRSEEFDYIIAHGIYSWVPRETRDALLRICASRLAPNGVAYVSYNTLPGCYARLMVRDAMLFHTRSVTDVHEKIKHARTFLRFLMTALPTGMPLWSELHDTSQRSDAALYHDDIAPVNDPIYFEEFVRHANAHDLRYVADAIWLESQDEIFPRELREELDVMQVSDIAVKGQYMDFVRLRSFRRSLLCRRINVLNRQPDSGAMMNCYVTSLIQGVTDQQFKNYQGEIIRVVDNPLVIEVLQRLRRSSGYPIRFGHLLRMASQATGVEISDDQAVCRTFLSLCAAQLICLHTHCPNFVLQPRERPETTPLVRAQAQRSPFVTNLRFQTVDLGTSLARDLLPLLDGTRDRMQLQHDLRRTLTSKHTTENHALPESSKNALNESEVNRICEALGRSALLTS